MRCSYSQGKGLLEHFESMYRRRAWEGRGGEASMILVGITIVTRKVDIDKGCKLRVWGKRTQAA